MKQKILVTGTSVRKELLQPLLDAGYVVKNPTHLLSESELTEELRDSAGYLLGGDEHATRAALSSAKNLKIIAFLGMGYDSFVDVEAAREFQIPITNTPGTLSNSVAEFTVGLTLNCTRRLFFYASEYSAGRSGSEQKQHDLGALHVGILGLGGVGLRTAEILRMGFGSQTSYFSRTRKPDEESRLGISYLPLDRLVSQVDVIIILTPGNDETKGLIGHAQLSSCKPGLILVNIARPSVVDPVALLDGIESGQIGYAAFDGLHDEPLGTVERLKSVIPSRLMVTGHIGSLTHEARDGMALKATQSIINVLKTGKDKYFVNAS